MCMNIFKLQMDWPRPHWSSGAMDHFAGIEEFPEFPPAMRPEMRKTICLRLLRSARDDEGMDVDA